MRKIRNIKWMPVLMAITIFVITGFQLYWLKKSYEREERTLDMRTNMMFRETIRTLQASKLKLERFTDTSGKRVSIRTTNLNPVHTNQKMAGMMDVVMQRAKGGKGKLIIRSTIDSSGTSKIDTLRLLENVSPRQNRIMQFLFDVDSLQDSLRVKDIEAAYAARLAEQPLEIPFAVSRVPTRETEQPVFNEVTLGFKNPITYRLDLEDKTPFILKRLTAPILFSVFLVGFTILSFTLLYRNLVRQAKLADIKNEFISNITHELKTPIATVSVAIEALRNFSDSIDPTRRKEYLDISSNELQRLSLLVDKVLKLSMFEKKEIDLKYELLDMKSVVEEVTTSMRLQFEKRKAHVNITTDGDTKLEADRLHLVSVIFNLMDNALKYSTESPTIGIDIKGNGNKVELSIADSGIGISPEYHGKIFEKFFRVPTGNLHNAKGYGLGLSYVAHVVDKHNGSIRVDSVEGDGTRFIISIPKNKT